MRFDEISDMNATVSSSVRPIRVCDVVNRSSGFYPRVVHFLLLLSLMFVLLYGLRFCDFNGL